MPLRCSGFGPFFLYTGIALVHRGTKHCQSDRLRRLINASCAVEISNNAATDFEQPDCLEVCPDLFSEQQSIVVRRVCWPILSDISPVSIDDNRSIVLLCNSGHVCAVIIVD